MFLFFFLVVTVYIIHFIWGEFRICKNARAIAFSLTILTCWLFLIFYFYLKIKKSWILWLGSKFPEDKNRKRNVIFPRALAAHKGPSGKCPVCLKAWEEKQLLALLEPSHLLAHIILHLWEAQGVKKPDDIPKVTLPANSCTSLPFLQIILPGTWVRWPWATCLDFLSWAALYKAEYWTDCQTTGGKEGRVR